MAGKQGVNRIAAYNILSTVVLNALSFLSSPIFSRMLGTQQYGIITIYSTWASFFLLLIGLQTTGTIGTAWANLPKEKHSAYASSVMALSGLSFFAMLALVFVLRGPLSAASELGSGILLLMTVHGFGTFCVNFLNAKLTFDFSAGKNFILALAMSVSTIGLSFLCMWFMPSDKLYLGRILGMALPYCVMGLCIPLALWRAGRTLFQKEYWLFCLPLCIPLIFHGIAGIIQSQSDRIMLQKMMDNSVVGIYGLAYAFANVLETVRYAFNNSWVPFYYDYTGRGEIEKMLCHARNYLFLLTGLIMGFILLTPEVFHLYAGRAFWEGTRYIPVFAAGSFMMLLYTFPVNYEFYRRKTRHIAFASIMAALANIGMNLWLIPLYGAMGAAVATLASYVLLFVFHHCVAKYVLGGGYPFKVRIFLPYLAGVFAAAAAFYLLYDFWYLRWAMAAGVGVALVVKVCRNRALF
ncbi:MAG: oligosaccharide flippase family protein [Ruthenibacterium sp.]